MISRIVKLGDVVRSAQAGFACGKRDDTGLIQLRMNNVDTRGNFVWDDLTRIPASLEVVDEYLLHPGDVLFNNTNSAALVGKSALFQDFPEPVVYSNHFTRLRTREDTLLPGYLVAWLNHHWQQGVFERICNRWIGQSAVKADKLLKMELYLPPLEEQRSICSRLSHQFVAFDGAKAAAGERLAAANALAASYLRKEFDDPGLQMHPKRTMGEIVRLLPSKSISSSGDVALPVITTACLTEFGFDPAGIKEARMSASDAAESKVTKGEILIARSNTPELVGRVSMFPGMPSDIFASDLTIRIFPQDGTHAAYLMYFLMSLYIAGYWKERAGGASGSMKKITRTHIQNLEVPIPPSEEQVRISKLLDEAIAGARQLRSAAESHLSLISALPSTLLSEAFRVDA